MTVSCLVAGGLLVAFGWLLFGDEPAQLDNGGANPLATVPQWTMAVAAVLVVLALVPVVRRPGVAATHYALSVRPGVLRTLLLPWVSIAEVAIVSGAGERYLLVRLVPSAAVGDRPTYWDQFVLRVAIRHYPAAVGYHVAVRLDDFAGPPDAKLATIAAFAPETVYITDHGG